MVFDVAEIPAANGSYAAISWMTGYGRQDSVTTGSYLASELSGSYSRANL